MRQDPFERMQRNNPVPPDQVPSAAMGVADRIVGNRSLWPGWVIAVAAAAVVVVIGGGTLLLVNRTRSTVVADPTTSPAPVASTTEASVTTVTPTTGYPTTTLGPEEEFTTAVYLFADGVNDTAGSGPYLVPVARTVRDWSEEAGSLASLFYESADLPNGLSTAIPEGSTYSIRPRDGAIIDIDLSSEFVSGGGSFSMRGRLAQVVYSLTGIDGIDGVEFLIEGVPTTVFGGDGVELNRPATRADFEDLLPAILIETPAYGATAGNPLIATGSANVFEASVSFALTDADGLIIWEGFTTATCGTGCRGEWIAEIPYDVDFPQTGALIAWEESMRDGSQTNIREHPVWLTPADAVESTATTLSPDENVCSGGGPELSRVLVDQPELPSEVAAKRAAIFQAASDCDWEALRAELGDGFEYSFGGGGDAIAYWQELEAMGEEPMRFLAELLNMPYTFFEEYADGNYYVWPSAFGFEWDDVPGADREALRRLYDDADLVSFDDFGGYFGYRIGIFEDGTWWFFIAGD